MRRLVKAVLISDVHFSIKTLALATASLRAAFTEARTRKVPLIIAGDLSDTKALLRGECVNAILALFREFADVATHVIVGNHDLINEKGQEHSLNFLADLANVVRDVAYLPETDVYLIGYKHDVEDLKRTLSGIPHGSKIVGHMGVRGAHMGEYVIDKSSIDPADLAPYRVITGHYHRHHSIGTATFIGTPYTVTFTEASDGPKGIQLMHADHTMTQVPLDLRRHVIIEARTDEFDLMVQEMTNHGFLPRPQDLLWVKLAGPVSELAKFKKADIGADLIGHENFKLDRIPDKAADVELEDLTLPPDQLFDKLIDTSEETETQRSYLKALWRKSCV